MAKSASSFTEAKLTQKQFASSNAIACPNRLALSAAKPAPSAHHRAVDPPPPKHGTKSLTDLRRESARTHNRVPADCVLPLARIRARAKQSISASSQGEKSSGWLQTRSRSFAWRMVSCPSALTSSGIFSAIKRQRNASIAHGNGASLAAFSYWTGQLPGCTSGLDRPGPVCSTVEATMMKTGKEPSGCRAWMTAFTRGW
jgi:hypothetical protein